MSRLAVNATNYRVCLGTFFQARTKDMLHGLKNIGNVLVLKGKGKKEIKKAAGLST